MRGLDVLMLRAPGSVARALAVRCPVGGCHAQPGAACGLIGEKPEVHDQREALAYNAPKLTT